MKNVVPTKRKHACRTYKDVEIVNRLRNNVKKMTSELLWAGFEPAHLAIVELESTPLDRSGTKAFVYLFEDILIFLNERKNPFCFPFFQWNSS